MEAVSQELVVLPPALLRVSELQQSAAALPGPAPDCRVDWLPPPERAGSFANLPLARLGGATPFVRQPAVAAPHCPALPLEACLAVAPLSAVGPTAEDLDGGEPLEAGVLPALAPVVVLSGYGATAGDESFAGRPPR